MVIANQLIASRENLLEKLQSGFKHAFMKAIRDCLLAADGKKTPVWSFQTFQQLLTPLIMQFFPAEWDTPLLRNTLKAVWLSLLVLKTVDPLLVKKGSAGFPFRSIFVFLYVHPVICSPWAIWLKDISSTLTFTHIIQMCLLIQLTETQLGP